MGLFRLSLRTSPTEEWQDSPWAPFEIISIGLAKAFQAWMEIKVKELEEVTDESLEGLVQKFKEVCKLQSQMADGSIKEEPVEFQRLEKEELDALNERPSRLH